MRFDWYGASAAAKPEVVLEGLVRRLDLASVRRSRGLWGFLHGAEVHRGERVLATVMWGGTGPDTFVQGTGENAPAVAEYLRGSEFEHRVARADVAEDYSAEGAWDTLSGICLKVADLHRVRVEHAGDWHRGEAGRSIYLGGRDSAIRAVCYEKGKQLRRDPHWTRVELRVRPKGDGKSQAARAEPLRLFGGSRWSANLATELGAPAVERISVGNVYRADDAQRAREALVRQYAPTLRAWAAEVGGFEQLGREIEARVRCVARKLGE